MISASRPGRERERYNEGLQRTDYTDRFMHSRHYYRLWRHEILARVMAYAEGRRVLELGSMTWLDWIEHRGILAGELHCINISEVELEVGRRLARESRNKPTFHLMDAHRLAFEDRSFDLVYGNAILHHLDFACALDEVQRVLRPGGRVVFLEPLDLNPFARVVRRWTPHARTEDERPFRMNELREIRRRFDCRYHYEQLLSVPLGVLSKRIFNKPNNPMTWGAFKVDRALETLVPPLRPLYRQVLFEGTPRQGVGSTRSAA